MRDLRLQSLPMATVVWFDSPRRNPDLRCAARAPPRGAKCAPNPARVCSGAVVMANLNRLRNNRTSRAHGKNGKSEVLLSTRQLHVVVLSPKRNDSRVGLGAALKPLGD